MNTYDANMDSDQDDYLRPGGIARTPVDDIFTISQSIWNA
jgi:hypothetical protein